MENTMELTNEEIAMVNKLRADKAKAEEAAEQARRQQAIHKTVANLIAEAKTILIDAKQIAKDNGMAYEIGDMVTDMINEVSDGQYWYGSDQSLC